MRDILRVVRIPAAVALSLLVSCGSPGLDPTPSDARNGQVIALGDVTVLVSERSEAGMAALGGGTLEMVGGCLGASGYVIVWPHGTEVTRDDPLTIRIPGNGTFALGDDVSVTGGFVLEHSSHDVEPGEFQTGGVNVPAACTEHDIFLAH